MMNPVEILSGSWLDAHCALSVSSGQLNAAALYDQNTRTRWKSEGSGAGVTETISVAFKTAGGGGIAREFDTIILLNHNIAAMTAHYVNASGAQIVMDEAAMTGNAAGDSFIRLSSPATATAVTLNMTAAFPSGEQKAAGELKLCKRLLTLGNALCSFSRTDKTRQGYYYTAKGSLVAWREYAKTAGTFTAENLSLTDRNTLLSAVREQDFLTFIMHRDFDAREVFEFAVIAPVSEKLDRRSGVYTLNLEVAER